MTRRLRMIALLIALVGCAGYFAFQQVGTAGALGRLPGLQRLIPPGTPPGGALPGAGAAALNFDDDTMADIRHYFDGVSVPASENNMGEAMRLDQAVGRPQMARGQYREAYLTYQKVLAISYQHGDPMGVGLALNVLGSLAHRAGNMDEAMFGTFLAYKVAARLNNKEESGVVELSLARMLKDKDVGLSLMWFLRARESLKGSQYREDYVRALPGLAQGLRELDKDKEASQILAEAWDIARGLGDAEGQRWAKAEVAIAYADDLRWNGEPQKSAAVLEEVRPILGPDQRRTDTYTGILHRLAQAHAGMQQDAVAAREFLAAYANYELTRADAAGEEARATLDKNNTWLVDDLVLSLVRQKEMAASLAVLETNKARTLNDAFGDPSYRQAQDQWKEMERRQAKEVSEFFEPTKGGTPKDALVPADERALFARLTAIARKHDEERRSLQTSLQMKEMVVTPSLTKEDVERLARALPADMAVLSFFARGDHPGVFVIAAKRVQYVAINADMDDLHRTMQQLRLTLTNPDNDFYREPARRLYERVIAPALALLPKTVTVLLFSPDDLLANLPLEVLMQGEHFLGERYAVYRVPSLRYATSPAAVKAVPATHGIACVDPEIEGGRLPFQQETGRALEKRYGGDVTTLVGKDCVESRLVEAIAAQKGPAFLHIGAHGSFYPEDPMESAIWLSPESRDGAPPQPWNAKAMATVDLGRIDLVTLSSCESGLLDQRRPRDVFGIGRSLFFAGAKSVVAPLWSVEDQSTADAMQAFHAAYGRGLPAVLALKQAHGTLRASARYSHPFYWSGFVLTGVPR